MIAIVDYDAGNIKSVEKALQYLGEEPVVTRDAGILNRADKVIVPGVGAFGDAMGKMHQYDLAGTALVFPEQRRVCRGGRAVSSSRKDCEDSRTGGVQDSPYGLEFHTDQPGIEIV